MLDDRKGKLLKMRCLYGEVVFNPKYIVVNCISGPEELYKKTEVNLMNNTTVRTTKANNRIA